MVALLRADGHDRRRADRGTRAPGRARAAAQRAGQEVDRLHVLVPGPGPPDRRGHHDRRPGDGRRRRHRRERSTTWPRPSRSSAGPSLARRGAARGRSCRRASSRAESWPRASCGRGTASPRHGLAAVGATIGGEAVPASVRDLLLRTPPRRRTGPGRAAPTTRRDGGRRRDADRPGDAGSGPADPGAPGLGEDLHRRPDDREPRRAREAGRRRRQQPQGHRQGAGRGGQGRHRARAGPFGSARSRKGGQGPTHAAAIVLKDNADVEAALRSRTVDVVGAVAWTWCRPEFARPVPVLDVLVVDEAGQMSLANVLACAPSARTIVLLGDPQQLDQPTQGSHPPGADRSALSHLLADPAYLAPTGRRSGPRRGCSSTRPGVSTRRSATSPRDAFYAGRLRPRDGLEGQAVIAPRSAGPLSGTGLRYLPVPHAGNDTDSAEEARTIAELVRSLLETQPTWIDRRRPRGLDDRRRHRDRRPVQRPRRRDRACRGDRRAPAVVRGDGGPVPGPGGPDQHLRDGDARARRTPRAGWSSCTRSTG